jgi:hypothetical protein
VARSCRPQGDSPLAVARGYDVTGQTLSAKESVRKGVRPHADPEIRGEIWTLSCKSSSPPWASITGGWPSHRPLCHCPRSAHRRNPHALPRRRGPLCRTSPP